ncbi:hypothetical protein [Raineyella sp. LH-20]|uniref:hypothetical protein n=1 Tax=Raineyella sp. LH-20 TaxID=3081204 RepID=UPI0029531F42|nr:hypothetical protein [Raineyella sp. LH-20]WOP17405.1 hypothetical protein R0146_08930 [Raineyella sp. LH-20]
MSPTTRPPDRRSPDPVSALTSTAALTTPYALDLIDRHVAAHNSLDAEELRRHARYCPPCAARLADDLARLPERRAERERHLAELTARYYPHHGRNA